MTDWNDDDEAVLRHVEDLIARSPATGALCIQVPEMRQVLTGLRRLRDEARSTGPSAREREIESLARAIFVQTAARTLSTKDRFFDALEVSGRAKNAAATFFMPHEEQRRQLEQRYAVLATPKEPT